MRTLAFHPDAIAGGIVQRAFTSGTDYYRSGQRISGEALRSMPTQNMRALVENRFIELFPTDNNAERFIVPAGKGQFHVIAGHKLNSAPLSREDAEDLATRP
jgi:hypothetical protein